MDVAAAGAQRNSQSDAFPFGLFALAREAEPAYGNPAGAGLRSAAASVPRVAHPAVHARTIWRASRGGIAYGSCGTRLRGFGKVAGVSESAGAGIVRP